MAENAPVAGIAAVQNAAEHLGAGRALGVGHTQAIPSNRAGNLIESLMVLSVRSQS